MLRVAIGGRGTAAESSVLDYTDEVMEVINAVYSAVECPHRAKQLRLNGIEFSFNDVTQSIKILLGNGEKIEVTYDPSACGQEYCIRHEQGCNNEYHLYIVSEMGDLVQAAKILGSTGRSKFGKIINSLGTIAKSGC